jgi:hypothetical protein
MRNITIYHGLNIQKIDGNEETFKGRLPSDHNDGRKRIRSSHHFRRIVLTKRTGDEKSA